MIDLQFDYLLYPSIRKEDGFGHLLRMLALHTNLPRSAIFISPSCNELYLKYLYTVVAELHKAIILREISNHTLLVIDMPTLNTAEFENLRRKLPILAIDLGGCIREQVDFLIDTLPYPGHKLHKKHFFPAEHKLLCSNKSREAPANISTPAFLPLEAISSEKASTNTGNLRIFVSFGGSKQTEFIFRFIEYLNAQEWLKKQRGFIFCPHGGEYDLPQNWTTVGMKRSIYEHLKNIDLCIMSYGISCWQAQFVGIPTLVIPTSPYHLRLAQLSVFHSLPISLLSQLLSRTVQEKLKKQVKRVQSIVPRSLAQFIQTLKPLRIPQCPCCNSSHNASFIHRDSKRSYLVCPQCRTIYAHYLNAPRTEYNEEYFFQDYTNQYGRSYLEDFENIKEFGRKRLLHINSLQAQHKGKFLDIGAAYGAFVSVVAEMGYRAEAVDISNQAVHYISSELGLNAIQGDIQEANFRQSFASESYNVVSLWYVIEHFPNISNIFQWLHRILRPGGVLALSTPNSKGISGRKSIKNFLESSPIDHFTFWSPSQARNVGNLYGFELKKWVSVGHHAERFPSIFATPPFRIFSYCVSKICKLGDTMELYYVKR